MIVTVEPGIPAERVRQTLVERGLWVTRYADVGSSGCVRFVVEDGSRSLPASDVLAIPGVAEVDERKTSRPRLDRQPTIVEIGPVRIGPPPLVPPVVMAGPCSVESRGQIHAIAARLSRLGVRVLRGGADKMRTSPYAFRGHGVRAMRWLRDAADAHGMLVVAEAVGVRELEHVAGLADLVQIGSRNMHNTALLEAAGETGKPLLLKRGMAATVDEWLLAGERCLLHGAAAVIFCERGIRGFDPSTRNVLDLGAAVLLARVHGLPVIVDPSHATGRRDLIPWLSRAALAAGVSGLMLEVHDEPGRALSDGSQALPLDEVEPVLEGILSFPPAPFLRSA